MKFFAVRFVFSSLSLSPSPSSSSFSTPHQPFSTTASSDELCSIWFLLSLPFLFISFLVFFPPVLMFFYSVFVTEMHSAHSTIIKFNLTSKTVPLFPTNKFTRPRSAAMDYRRKFILVDSFRFNH